MKRFIIATFLLLFVCIINTSAYADYTSARILLGDREANTAPSPMYDGKRVLAPIEILKSFGATYAVSNDGKGITVTSAAGKSGDIILTTVNGTKMVPMDALVSLIGGEAKWDSTKRALVVLAKLESTEFVDGVLKINCSFPVTYSVGSWKNKLWLDLNGTKLSSNIPVYVGNDDIERARPGQFKDTIARIALDLKKNVGYKIESSQPSAHILFRVGENVHQSDQVESSQESDVKQVMPAKSNGGFEVSSINLNKINADEFEIVLTTTSKGSAGVSYGVYPPQVNLTLSGGTFSDSTKSVSFSHPLIKSMSVSGSKLDISFARPVVYSMVSDKDSIDLNICVPNNAGGKLSDKLIVLDPGHGSYEKGAVWNGIEEKTINLKIANDVAAALRKEGAKVILTRTSDVQMGLAARSEVAISNKADFFISLHCNSNHEANSASGIETYYHMRESSPMALAYSIHAGICSATGMCDRKARSDRTLYGSGLGVLRRLSGSGIPGILVECGYINNSKDCAKLLDSGYRAKLAEGIVAGLKAYISGSPIK